MSVNWLSRMFGKRGGAIAGKEQSTPDTRTGGWEIVSGSTPWQKADGLWKDYTAAELEKVYAASAVVHACARLISSSLLTAPVDVGKYDEEGNWESDEGNDALALLQAPNPYYSYGEFLSVWALRLILTGTSFVWKWRARGGWPAELWPVPTSWVTVKTGTGSRLIDHYEVRQGYGKAPAIVSPEDMFYVRFPDPCSLWDGVSPLKAASRPYQLDVERDNYLIEMLSNMDVMGPVLKQTPGQLPFTSDQRADLREKLHDIAGYGKRGGVPVLPPGVDIAFPGVMEDLDWPGLSMLSETRICAALGVPAMLVGVRAGVEHSTYSNHESARKGFFTTTMVSLWDTLDDALTKGLLRAEGESGLEFKFLLSAIRELQEDEAQKTARAATAFSGGIITRNEARALIGQPKDDLRGDYYVMPAMNIEVPANREPEDALPVDTSIPAEE